MRRWKLVTGLAAGVLIAITMVFATAGFFDRDAIRLFQPTGPRSAVSAIFFSGDMGLRYGMGAATSRALARHGIEVVGVSSSTLFSTRRTGAEVNAIVAGAVRQGLARTGAPRLVLIGQSYGADVLQTGLAALPVDLRGRIAAVVLVVPGETVFFRADPSGLVYRGAPDSLGVTTAPRIDWAPLTCIYGVAETDSLCPKLRMANLRVVPMPGGHFLAHDTDGTIARILSAIGRDVPGALHAT